MARRRTDSDEPEQPQSRDYVAEVKQHVAQFGHTSIIDAMISSMSQDDARSVLERIKGHKVSEEGESTPETE